MNSWSDNKLNNLKLEVMFTIQIDEIRLAEVVRQAVKQQMESRSDGAAVAEVKEKGVFLYSLKELADFLHCSTPTAQRMKNEGRIPYKQTGRKVIYDTEEILRSMEHVPGKKSKLRK